MPFVHNVRGIFIAPTRPFNATKESLVGTEEGTIASKYLCYSYNQALSGGNHHYEGGTGNFATGGVDCFRR